MLKVALSILAVKEIKANGAILQSNIWRDYIKLYMISRDKAREYVLSQMSHNNVVSRRSK